MLQAERLAAGALTLSLPGVRGGNMAWKIARFRVSREGDRTDCTLKVEL